MDIDWPLFEGHHQVKALWFDAGERAEELLHDAVLAYWESGSRLYRLHTGYLLIWPQARWLHCQTLPALALCDINGLLSSAPITDALRAQLTTHTVLLVLGSKLYGFTPGNSERIDPSLWIKVHGIAVREVLQPPPANIEHVNVQPSADKTLSDILGDAMPKASPERERFLAEEAARMRGEPIPGTNSESTPGLGARAKRAAAMGALGALGALNQLLNKFFGSGKPVDVSQYGAPGRPGSINVKWQPRRHPLRRKLDEWMEKLVIATKISNIIGARQADFLNNMMDMFTRGDLENALRNAIPIDAKGDAEQRHALGNPNVRSDLRITGPKTGGTYIGLHDSVQDRMRQLYRQAFEKLDRAGRIDEAVFVLAELLNAGTEAVTYLEKKERFKQAAELAELLELQTPIIVRLWWLAGDTKRAIELARLTGSFSQVITLLERNRLADAHALRRVWGADLARRGDWVEAANAIWPVTEERHMAIVWLTLAERAGGSLGVRALVRKLLLAPESLKHSAPAIEQLLANGDETGAVERARLVAELLALPEQSTATRKLFNPLARGVIADQSKGYSILSKLDFDRLLGQVNSAALKADMPTVKHQAGATHAMLVKRTDALKLTLAETGLGEIHDARALADGKYLLAMGESGILCVNRVGRKLMHFPIPATKLVLAASGQRGLALITRDRNYRISQFDLITGSAADWAMTPLDFWADEYDGIFWNCVIGNRLVSFDTTRDALTVSWQVTDLPGKMLAFGQEGERQTLLFHVGTELQQWRYRLPLRRLEQRDGLPLPEQGWGLLLDVESDLPLQIVLEPTAEAQKVETEHHFREHEISLHYRRDTSSVAHSLSLGAITAPPLMRLHRGMLAIRTQNKQDSRLRLVNLQSKQIVADISMPNSDTAVFALQEKHTLFHDHQGRLLDIDWSGPAHSLCVG